MFEHRVSEKDFVLVGRSYKEGGKEGQEASMIYGSKLGRWATEISDKTMRII